MMRWLAALVGVFMARIRPRPTPPAPPTPPALPIQGHSVTVKLPAVDRYVDFLESQSRIQSRLDAATQSLKQSNARLRAALGR